MSGPPRHHPMPSQHPPTPLSHLGALAADRADDRLEVVSQAPDAHVLILDRVNDVALAVIGVWRRGGRRGGSGGWEGGRWTDRAEFVKKVVRLRPRSTPDAPLNPASLTDKGGHVVRVQAARLEAAHVGVGPGDLVSDRDADGRQVKVWGVQVEQDDVIVVGRVVQDLSRDSKGEKAGGKEGEGGDTLAGRRRSHPPPDT